LTILAFANSCITPYCFFTIFLPSINKYCVPCLRTDGKQSRKKSDFYYAVDKYYEKLGDRFQNQSDYKDSIVSSKLTQDYAELKRTSLVQCIDSPCQSIRLNNIRSYLNKNGELEVKETSLDSNSVTNSNLDLQSIPKSPFKPNINLYYNNDSKRIVLSEIPKIRENNNKEYLFKSSSVNFNLNHSQLKKKLNINRGNIGDNNDEIWMKKNEFSVIPVEINSNILYRNHNEINQPIYDYKNTNETKSYVKPVLYKNETHNYNRPNGAAYMNLNRNSSYNTHRSTIDI
jgi:hypothetical protein